MNIGDELSFLQDTAGISLRPWLFACFCCWFPDFLFFISSSKIFHLFSITLYIYMYTLSDYQTICVVKSLNPIDFSIYPLVISYVAIEAMAHFEIVDWPMNSMVIVHSFVVCLPEGKSHEKSREKSHLTSINSHGKSHFLGGVNHNFLGKSHFSWVNHTIRLSLPTFSSFRIPLAGASFGPDAARESHATKQHRGGGNVWGNHGDLWWLR